MQYVYGFVAAALVGAFTIVGLAGSYTRMLLKTESFNQVREERETLRKNYKQMAQIAHDRDVQVASLGALASEVTALYGLRQNKLNARSTGSHATSPRPPRRASLSSDDVNQQDVKLSIDQFYALRDTGDVGPCDARARRRSDAELYRRLDAACRCPSLWPIEGRVASSFGEREDPFNGEGAFHSGIDIDAPYGTPVRAAAEGDVSGASTASVMAKRSFSITATMCALSTAIFLEIAVVPGQHVIRGQVIGYVGQSGRATGRP